MCCCNCACFYKARIIILAGLSCCEAVFGLFRYVIFLSPAISLEGRPDISNVANVTDPIAIAFFLDVGSSIMGIFMGISLVLFLVLILTFSCFICIYAVCRNRRASDGKSCCGSLGGTKALHRFITFDCNCPCYRARPKLRFRLRMTFLCLCLALRGAAIYLYKVASGKQAARWSASIYSSLV